MRKNSLIVIGIILVVVGTIVSYFSSFALADITAFAVTMFGAGLACSGIWGKKDKNAKTWLQIVSLVLLGVGAFLLGVTGFVENTMTTIMSSVFGVIAIIASLIIPIIKKD